MTQGVDALWERMERMVAHGPVFCDITWGAGGSTADATLDIAIKMQHLVGWVGLGWVWGRLGSMLPTNFVPACISL